MLTTTIHTQESLIQTLDEFHQQLIAQPDGHIVRQIIVELSSIQNQVNEDSWLQIAAVVRQHTLWQLLWHHDPFTKRAFDKPRGYPGDAVMLDYMYFGLTNTYQHPNAITSLGKIIFRETIGSPSGDAARNRKQILADYVDATAERVEQPTILSVACGHLREAAISRAFQQGKIGCWYALDQDRQSLADLQKTYGADSPIVPIEASIRDLIMGTTQQPPADFVYAAGLYDYLDEPKAMRLLQTLFALVKPGGQLLIANFASDSGERAYMESIMDWWLTYRTEANMNRLATALPAPEVGQVDVFRDATERVIYLIVNKL